MSRDTVMRHPAFQDAGIGPHAWAAAINQGVRPGTRQTQNPILRSKVARLNPVTGRLAKERITLRQSPSAGSRYFVSVSPTKAYTHKSRLFGNR